MTSEFDMKLPDKPEWALTRVTAPSQAIFLHTLKSCGTSIYEVARKYDNFHYSPQANHLQVSEGKRGIEDHAYGGFIFNYESCFTFTIVRNPFDRFISAWLMVRRWGAGFSLDDAINIAGKKSSHRGGLYSHQRCFWDHVRPMVEMPLGMLSFVGRYEDIENSWGFVKRAVGIEDSLPSDNVGRWRNRDYRVYYNSEQMERVRELYAEDLLNLGYGF